MKKIVVVCMVIVVIISGVILKVNYDRTHFTACIYRKTGYFDNGLGTFDTFRPTGKTMVYSLDELKALAETCRVAWIGWQFGQEDVLGFGISEDTALVVYGIGPDSDVAETYYMSL